MTHTHASVPTSADDLALSGKFIDIVSRLGCTESVVLPLPTAHASMRSGTRSHRDLTIVGLASGSEIHVRCARDIVAQLQGSAVIVLQAIGREDGVRARRELSPFARIVESADDLAFEPEAHEARQTLDGGHRRTGISATHTTAPGPGSVELCETEAAVSAALAHLEHSFGGVTIFIRLPNDSSRLCEAAGRGLPGSGGRGPVALLDVSDEIVATGLPVRFDDMDDSLAIHGPGGTAAAIRSVIGVPIEIDATVSGSLTLGSEIPGRFSTADAHAIGEIAGRLGVAVANARVHTQVRRAKLEWEHTFDAIDDPIAVFDNAGALLRGNRALAAIMGLPITALTRVACRDVGLCSGPFPACAVGDAVVRGVAGTAEITLDDGRIFSVTTFPASGAGGPSVVQVAKNVTEEIRSARRLRQISHELAVSNARLTATIEQLKSTQAQLLQAEKLSALGRLVAGVAHELNNPLTSVIGYAQLLEEELLTQGRRQPPRLTADIAQDLRRIVEESERAARIVRNLLSFARRQSAARAPQDIVELATRVLALRAYDHRLNAIDVRTSFDAILPTLMADGGQVQQALLNLILNAEQAMRGRAVRCLTIAARFDPAASAVVVSVTDTGHGVEPASLPRIFDPFFTTREIGEGTGLGLSICYGVVRDHGGQILVESRVQVGTTFSVLLPAAAPASALTCSEPMLVAHTDQGERDFIGAALVAWGFNLASTSEAGEALERYRAGGIQAVLVDRGILSADLAAWSAARDADRRRTPMVLVGGSAGDDQEIDRFVRQEACAVLTPPFELRALRSAVRAVSKESV